MRVTTRSGRCGITAPQVSLQGLVECQRRALRPPGAVVDQHAAHSSPAVHSSPQQLPGPWSQARAIQAATDPFTPFSGSTSTSTAPPAPKVQFVRSSGPASSIGPASKNSQPNLAISYTTTILPLCTVQEVQLLLRSLEVPEYALRALKEQGVSGCDLLMLGWTDLTACMRFTPVVARKVLYLPLSWQLLCLLSGSDARFVLDMHQMLAALTQAGLCDHTRTAADPHNAHSTAPASLGTASHPGMVALPHPVSPSSPAAGLLLVPLEEGIHPCCPLPKVPGAPAAASFQAQHQQQRHAVETQEDGGAAGSSGSLTVSEAAAMHRPLRGLTRMRVLFHSLDGDRDGILTMEELARGLPLLTQVLMEELWVMSDDEQQLAAGPAAAGAAAAGSVIAAAAGAAPGSAARIPDPVLRCRLLDVCERVSALAGNPYAVPLVRGTPEPEA